MNVNRFHKRSGKHEVTGSYLAHQLSQRLTSALLRVNLYKLARGALIVALDPLPSLAD